MYSTYKTVSLYQTRLPIVSDIRFYWVNKGDSFCKKAGIRTRIFSLSRAMPLSKIKHFYHLRRIISNIPMQKVAKHLSVCYYYYSESAIVLGYIIVHICFFKVSYDYTIKICDFITFANYSLITMLIKS